MALFRKTPELFGLDIGSRAGRGVQVLRASGGGGGGGRKAGVKGKEAAIAICGRELIIKKVQIPQVPPKEVHDVVQLEAEHHIPFAIDEVFLDYHGVGQHDGVMDLILVAVKKSKVLEYSAVVEEAGLIPSIVDVDSFALGNQF